MIAIFRHGETEYNRDSKHQGFDDSPLTDDGKSQVRKCAKHFQYHFAGKTGLPVDVFHSSSKRSIESENLFEKYVEVVNVVQTENLRENSWGKLEGVRTTDERSIQYLKHRKSDPFGIRPTGGESLADVYERVSRCLDFYRIREDNPCRITVFHVHCNVSKVLRGIFHNHPVYRWIEFEHPFDHYYILQGIVSIEVNV